MDGIKVQASLLCDAFNFGPLPELGDWYRMSDDPEIWGEVTYVQQGHVTITMRMPPISDDVLIEIVKNL